ncbi:MAG: hypothetical protein C5B52_06015 [Bacteroidetes bacterium]|nr:MAG: hypothetical protein C5B52_06015 [Bacteroidota bacterium]
MNTRNLLLLAAVVGLGSCTTMYKSGQTPDDVYYSPGSEKEGYVQSKNNTDNNQPFHGNEPSDDYLRMKVQDPARWSTLDYDAYGNYNPYYNPYSPYGSFGYSPYGTSMSFGFGMGYPMYSGLYFGSYFNPFGFYGSYNPYYPYYYGTPVVIVKGGTGTVNPYINRPRTFSNAGYGNTAYVRGGGAIMPKATGAPASAGPAPVRVFNNVNNSTSYSGSSGGSYLRGGSSGRSSTPFTPSSSGSHNSSTRTFEPRSSNSSSGSSFGGSRSSGGSSGGGGSAPARSFPGRR